MYYVKKGFQLILLAAIIWVSVENFGITVAGMRIFSNEIIDVSVIFVIFASMIIGGMISAFFSAVKEWKNARENRKKISEMKSTIKDLELKNKDYQIAMNEIERLKAENTSLKSEVGTLKEVISSTTASSDKKIEY